MKRIDITNKTFGRLTAIHFNGMATNGSARWLCMCDCGKQTIVRADHLLRKVTLSCGCYRRECLMKRKAVEVTIGPYEIERRRINKNLKSKDLYHRIKGSDNYKAKRKRADQKRRINPISRLNSSLRRAINQSLKRGKMSIPKERILGYTLGELVEHLEKQFVPNMTWDNYGPKWHVDYKIPLAAFNFEKPTDIDFKKAWALKNLQPLWACKNIKKQDKLDKPFQPSLIFS